MKMEMLKCPECDQKFAVETQGLVDDEVCSCPKCEASVDMEEDRAEIA